MTLVELKLKIPEYAKEELDRIIEKFSNEKLKGEYNFDIHSMITLMIMTFEDSKSKLVNTDKIINKIRNELKEYYKI